MPRAAPESPANVGMSKLELGRLKAKEYKRQLMEEKKKEQLFEPEGEDMDLSFAEESTYVDNASRRRSTGAAPRRMDSKRRETVASSAPSQRRGTTARAATTLKPAAQSPSVSVTGWEGLAEDCYTNDEVQDIWDDALQEDDTQPGRAPHIERIVSPVGMLRTALAIAAIAGLLFTSEYAHQPMAIGIATIIVAEYFCDYPWFQLLSGLSLGFVFAVLVVLLFVFRRYTKPSVIAGVFALGLSRLNVVTLVLSPVATSMGLSAELLVRVILSAAALLLFISSSIWYCTSSFPVDNFRRFIKFFFTVVVGAGSVFYSFFVHADGVNKLRTFLATQQYISVPEHVLSRAWLINAAVIVLLAITFLRINAMADVYEDICCLYSDCFGESRVRPVATHCTRRTEKEERRISSDFTRKQVQLLNQTISAMSDDVLMEKLTPEGYFQVQQARL